MLTYDFSPVAVLEQPSSRRLTDRALGRRNIVLPQSGELNPAAGTRNTLPSGCAGRKLGGAEFWLSYPRALPAPPATSAQEASRLDAPVPASTSTGGVRPGARHC